MVIHPKRRISFWLTLSIMANLLLVGWWPLMLRNAVSCFGPEGAPQRRPYWARPAMGSHGGRR